MSYKATEASQEALTPRYGGQIVEELVTVDGEQSSQTFKWADGYTVEVCSHGAYVTRFIDLELIARAGDSWPDEVTLARQVAADVRARNETRVRTETARRERELDREFDLLFEVAP